jgi:hypothetical protein
MQEMISLAVEGAVAKVVRDSDSSSHAVQVDCRGELKQMRDTISSGFATVNGRLDEFKDQLAEGNTKFAVLALEQTHIKEKIGTDRRPRRAVTEVDPDSAPLISPKLWNTLILAVVTAVGAGIGALAWERLRRPDPVVAPQTTQPTGHQQPLPVAAPVQAP